MFIEHGSDLVLNHPAQRERETIFAFKERYTDYLYLDAFINDAPNHLSRPNDLVMFVSSTLDSEFYHQQWALEKHSPKHRNDFTPSRIVHTLERWRTMKQARRIVRSNPYASRSSSSTTRPPKSINQLTTNDIDDSAPEDSTNDSEPTSCPITESIFKIAVKVLEVKPEYFHAPRCIVCKATKQIDDEHPFEECKLLRNHKLLQEQHKNVCRFINNTLKLTEKAEAELNALTTTNQVDEAKTELLALIDQTCND